MIRSRIAERYVALGLALVGVGIGCGADVTASSAPGDGAPLVDAGGAPGADGEASGAGADAHAGPAADQLTLAWHDNANDEDGFRVERKLGPGGTFAEITTTGPNVITYVDASLAPAMTYCYRVRAYNAAGASAHTNESCATTKGP